MAGEGGPVNVVCNRLNKKWTNCQKKSEKMQLAALLGVVFCLLPGFTNSEVFSSVADMQVDTVFHQGKSKLALDTKTLLSAHDTQPVPSNMHSIRLRTFQKFSLLRNSDGILKLFTSQAVFQLERSLVNILLDYAGKLQGKLSRIKK